MTIKLKNYSVADSQNVLKIRVSPKLNRTFTLNLRPIHFKRTIAYDLVEWVEYYRLMGVDHFVVYNFTSDPLTDSVLNYYVAQGYLDVIQWHVPKHIIPKRHYYNLAKHNDLHTAGQFAMHNDFLYRVFWSTEYVVNVDLDEFLVPMHGLKNFRELVDKQPEACEYLIRNTLVPTDITQTSKDFPNRDLAEKYHLKTLPHRRRRNYVFKERWKTKYIAHTKCAQTLWLHYVIEKRPSEFQQKRHVIDTNQSLVFHYRNEFAKPMFQRGTENIDEHSLQPFTDDLVNNVKVVWDQVGLPQSDEIN